MQKRTLGKTKLRASEIGLGCMGMSEFYGATDEKTAINTLHKALELEVNFYDTADIYGKGENEALLAKAFKQHWNKIIIATKFGIMRHPETGAIAGLNGRPEYVRAACDASLQRLGIDVIDLFYLHRKDANVAIEETVGAMADLVLAGKVRYLGLSEVNANTLEKAHLVHPITALQTEYSLWSREPEKELLPLCEKLQISFIPYSPLGRGFLTNASYAAENLAADDYRKTTPRFQEANFIKNQQLLQQLAELAKVKNCTNAQLALAWVLAKSPAIIPIPGTKKIQYLEENIAASTVKLEASEVAQLDALFHPDQVAGARLPAGSMQWIDQ